MESWVRDVTYALRSLAAARKFTLIVVATLALGIGANTAVFSVLDAVVLEPLPYDEPERLVRIYQSSEGQQEFLPAPPLLVYRDTSRTLDIAAVYTYRADGADLTDRGRPERVRLLPVSADYFRVLGVEPIVGRVFERADERADSRVAVISERVWRDYLDGAVDAPGRMLSLNGIPHRVVAILPRDFDDPLQPGVDVWTPIDLRPTGDSSAWQNSYLSAVARLRPGATLEQAQAELAAISATLQPNYGRGSRRRSALVQPLHADMVGSSGRTLWMLLGAVGLLLLIACVNVASLFLARGAARESELAVRSALGCSRGRLVRQLLIEALMLSVAGGAAGLLLAQGVVRALLAAAPDTIARSGAALDGTVFVFSLAVAVAAGIVFGAAPAVQFTRPALETVLRESGRSGSGSRRQARARSALVVCQIALALVLLVGAGLLLRTFERLQAVDLGIDPAEVLTFDVHLPAGRYALAEARARFYQEFHRRVAAMPGVRAVGAVSRLPATGTYHSWGTRRPDLPPDSPPAPGEQRVIEGDYFEALRIPLVRGRLFGPQDDERAPGRAVVSQELVRQLFPGEDPLGRTIRTGGRQLEIIGVVGDVGIAVRGRLRSTVYHSHRQFASNRNWALVQVVALERPSAGLVAELRHELAAIDPALVLYQPRLLTDVVGAGIAQERFALLLIASFAVVALALAAIGVYGMLSYSVSRRRREIGIRMALGAHPGSVRTLIVVDGGKLAAAGVVSGLAIAYVATRALASLLFGVSATEPLVYATAAVTVVIVALAASWIPARAATKVEPVEVLGA